MTTVSADTIEVLAGVGFDDNEARVYLAALALGPSTVWEIAKTSGVKRPTCYVILDTLVFRGLASQSATKKAALYSVITPKQLLARVRTRQERFERQLEQLEGLTSRSLLKPVIRFYEGLAGVKEAYSLGLQQPRGSTILVYATAAVVSTLPEFTDWYFAEKKRRNLTTHVIFSDTPENRTIVRLDKEQNRVSRLLSLDKFNPTIEMNLFADTLIYAVHSGDQPFATVVENRTIATLERQAFALLWAEATPPTKSTNPSPK